LSDASLYRQVMAKVAPLVKGGTPVFNYILTYYGHVDYPLNAERPKVITTTDKNALLNNYVNLMHYKSRELMNFLGKLRQDDQDGLIILFGDHLPFRAWLYGFLLETADRQPGDDDRPMIYTLTATPLVVIDQRAARAPGDAPMYRCRPDLDLLGPEGGLSHLRHPGNARPASAGDVLDR
jgi:phosphoglycerol transferase MdoB-like AlkP superfamily enzyme